MMLASELVEQGHEVQLITLTPGAEQVDCSFQVSYNPGFRKMMRLLSWCDVYFQNQISLRLLWPWFLNRRPLVFAVHNWMPISGPDATMMSRFKQRCLGMGSCVAVSKAVADHIKAPAQVIPNAYRSNLFFCQPDLPKTIDLLFVGRLVSDKGAHILLQAMGKLRSMGLQPSLKIVGSGPEEQRLRQMCAKLNIGGQVEFPGAMSPQKLNVLYNSASIVVIPSVWQEPFGLIALEALACGCVLVASRGGGLSEAVGDCGLLFDNGDEDGLADALHCVLTDLDLQERLRSRAEEHLSHFQPASQALRYLELFDSIL